MQFDKLSRFRLDEFVINKVGSILDILDLLVRSWIVFGIEGKGCSWLEMLSCGMESASRDRRVLGGGRHSKCWCRARCSYCCCRNISSEDSTHFQFQRRLKVENEFRMQA